MLDFDATDDAVHGRQVGRFFHGYYDCCCFLPLYVFCGDHLLMRYLRPSNIDGAKHAWAVLAPLVKRWRQTWPDVRITLRADRLILSSLAYGLIEAIRRLALEDTDMARAQAGTIGLKLLEIGAVVVRNTRRVAAIFRPPAPTRRCSPSPPPSSSPDNQTRSRNRKPPNASIRGAVRPTRKQPKSSFRS